MSEVVFCKKCVMSNQRPGSTIEFKNVKNNKKSLISLIKKAYVVHANTRKLKIMI